MHARPMPPARNFGVEERRAKSDLCYHHTSLRENVARAFKLRPSQMLEEKSKHNESYIYIYIYRCQIYIYRCQIYISLPERTLKRNVARRSTSHCPKVVAEEWYDESDISPLRPRQREKNGACAQITLLKALVEKRRHESNVSPPPLSPEKIFHARPSYAARNLVEKRHDESNIVLITAHAKDKMLQARPNLRSSEMLEQRSGRRVR
jgi:hypothetical protein